MAVRHGDTKFRQRIDQLIGSNQAKIDAILDDYGVPQLDQQGRVMASPRPEKP
jgi:hypothetical protein